MARDDYYVLVYRILEHLYKCLRASKRADIDYIKPLTKDFPIEQEYFDYIFRNLLKEEYIEDVVVISVDGAEPIIKILDSVKITPKGIAYLQDNSKMASAKKFIAEIIKNKI